MNVMLNHLTKLKEEEDEINCDIDAHFGENQQ